MNSSGESSSSLGSRSKIEHFNRLVKQNELKQLTNSFSSNWQQIKLTMSSNKPNKNDPGYGVPTNELTYRRGIQANNHISNEVNELCEIIKSCGHVSSIDGSIGIQFGELFTIYTAISNKVVGLLLRARKHGLVAFDGEMLFQGRDDTKIIKLI